MKCKHEWHLLKLRESVPAPDAKSIKIRWWRKYSKLQNIATYFCVKCLTKKEEVLEEWKPESWRD